MCILVLGCGLWWGIRSRSSRSMCSTSCQIATHLPECAVFGYRYRADGPPLWGVAPHAVLTSCSPMPLYTLPYPLASPRSPCRLPLPSLPLAISHVSTCLLPPLQSMPLVTWLLATYLFATDIFSVYHFRSEGHIVRSSGHLPLLGSVTSSCMCPFHCCPPSQSLPLATLLLATCTPLQSLPQDVLAGALWGPLVPSVHPQDVGYGQEMQQQGEGLLAEQLSLELDR